MRERLPHHVVQKSCGNSHPHMSNCDTWIIMHCGYIHVQELIDIICHESKSPVKNAKCSVVSQREVTIPEAAAVARKQHGGKEMNNVNNCFTLATDSHSQGK